MLDDALWDANNVHIPAATLHHAVPGTRPSFCCGADQPRLVVVRASACSCRVNLLSTCCQPVVQRRRVGCQWGHAEQSGASDIPLEFSRGGEHGQWAGRQIVM